MKVTTHAKNFANYIQTKILDQKEIPKLSYLNSFLNE
ncbi:uncharacterized protein METZ01_LOCUS513035 [marine metagenome]|uniref:Uncharacterized protein n=1 Tax=marine metagenome TaxID=408172 RepID=A0A383ETT9_9ZZZZ